MLCSAHRKIDWSFDLVLQSVNDGSLQIIIQTPTWTYGKPYDHDALGFKIRGIIGSMDKWFTDWNQKNLGNLEVRLVNDIGRTNKLVLPSSGVLWYLNPRMTSSGGMLCDVQYIPSGQSFPKGDASERANPTVQDNPKTLKVPVPEGEGKLK